MRIIDLIVKPSFAVPDGGPSVDHTDEPEPVKTVTVDSEQRNSAVQETTGQETTGQETTGRATSIAGLAADHASTVVGFDPSVHAVTAEGLPVLKADGEYAKRRGRKPIGVTADRTPVTARSAPSAVAVAVSATASHETCAAIGALAASTLFQVSQLLLGPEWAPDTDDKKMVPDAFTQYFASKKIEDVPPGLLLAFVLTTYALKRADKPTTKDRIAKLWGWMVSKFQKVRLI